jgi:hypothetical protein
MNTSRGAGMVRVLASLFVPYLPKEAASAAGCNAMIQLISDINLF